MDTTLFRSLDYRNNTSGFRGICLRGAEHPSPKKYIVRIGFRRANYHVGAFATFAAAKAARIDAEAIRATLDPGRVTDAECRDAFRHSTAKPRRQPRQQPPEQTPCRCGARAVMFHSATGWRCWPCRNA